MLFRSLLELVDLDLQAKIDKLKKDGRKSALLLVTGPDGELRFVALSLQ